MSLILAVTNGNEIVIGADSLAYEGSSEIYRTYEIPKLRLAEMGSWGCRIHWYGASSKDSLGLP